MLPKIEYPIFPIDVPSLKKKGRFRQWRTREEKVLLVAKESDATSDKLAAIYQIVNNCSVDITPDQMTTTDVEWIFLKLRELSVSSVVDISYHDPEDNADYPIKIELKDVKPPEATEPTKDFLAGDCGFTLRAPAASLYLNATLIDSGFNIDDVVALSVTKVWQKDGKTFTDFTPEEVQEFILDVDPRTMDEAREFILGTKSMEYTVRYTNSLGTERSIKLNSLPDFFTL